jgi:serine/threonine-protein kinase
MILIGQTVSHYRIESRLGEGGMGVVYQAVDLTLERNVALKFLPPGLAVTGEYRSRMFNEARAAASLMHPGICPVYEVGEHEGQAFIVMGHLEGPTLGERLKEEKLPVEQALNIFRQVAEALSAAHAKGIIHRDIKPDNVMITDGDRPVLMDFGLALVSGKTRLTQEGFSLGTLAYMAPEQLQGNEVDERTDIWALGVMLYEMLAGRPLFSGDFQAAISFSILEEDPEPLAASDNDIPPGLDGILGKALAKDPEERYAKVDDLLADLAELERDSGAFPAGRTRRKNRSRRRWKKWALRSGMVAAVLVITLLAWNTLNLTTGGPKISSLGILPLKNLSGDPAKNIWAEGITEHISTRLGTIASLKIVSDQTMKQFADRDDSLPDIGMEVDAEGLVDGSVTLDGNLIQITVKLYDAKQDHMLWSDTYRRPVSDILKVQNEIAEAIAEAVEVVLSDQESAELKEAREIDPEAYKAILSGWSLLNKLDEASINESILQFQSAIDIDPTFAEGYVGLARAYLWKALFGWSSFQEAQPLIQAGVDQALRIDDRDWKALTIRGSMLQFYHWDWEGAEQSYSRALAANPNYSEAQWWLASLLTIMGERKEAVAAAKRSVELDPLNGYNHLNLGWTLYFNGRPDEARSVLQATRRLHPYLAMWASNHLAFVAAGQGDLDEACKECDEAFRLMEGQEEHIIWAVCGGIYAHNGRRDEAQALADSMTAHAKRRFVDPFSLALIHDGLGDLDQAIAMLKKAQDEKSPQVWGMNIENWSPELQADPRFDELMQRMNYP